jgi:uncharacterized membrane protein YcaP (DUF421 family)
MPAALGSYGHIVISSVCVYIFIVLGIRIFGKKELAQLSTADLVFILLISNAVQNAMVGPDVSLGGGIVAALSLFVINYVFKLVMYYFPGVERIIEGHAVLLIYDGRVNYGNMKKSKISEDELMEAIREHGAATVREVDLAILEVDGNISVLSHDFKVKTSKERRPSKRATKDIE